MAISRKSPLVPALVDAVKNLGVRVTGRLLEAWSQEDLLPPDETPLDQLAAHVAELASIYRPGPGAADRAALILAARGFTCERYSAAFARSQGAASVTDLETQIAAVMTEPMPDPDTDDGSRSIEKRARSVVETATPSRNGPALDLLRGLLGDITRNAVCEPVPDPVVEEPTGDLGVPVKDTPETTVLSVLDQMYRVMYGGSVTSLEAMSRVVKNGSSELDARQGAALDALAGVESVVLAIMANLGSIPEWVLAAGAQQMRSLFASAGVESLPGLGDSEDLDRLAGMMAPAGLALAPMVYALGDIDVSSHFDVLRDLVAPKPDNEEEI